MDDKELETKVAAKVEELLAATNTPNKFLELLTCRRTLSVVAVILAAVAKHYGVNISNDELLTVGGVVSALVIGHSLRAPSRSSS